MDLSSKMVLVYTYERKMTSKLAVKTVDNDPFNVTDTAKIILRSNIGTL